MKLVLALALTALAAEPSVTMEQIDGQQWWSVRARDASLEKVLEQIARRSGRHLEGTAALERGAIVTVELNRRPLEQVLEYVVGPVGLSAEVRGDAIRIVSPGELDGEEQLARAAAAWARTTTRFPDHPFTPSARLAQGELAELHGDWGVARDHYQTLIENHPNAREVPEATLRLGAILQRLGLWAEAARQYRTLGGMEEGVAFHALARLELARCTIELGDPQGALHVLAALDATHPAADDVDRTGRLLVRARALNALERHMEALRTIDGVDFDLDALGRREAMRVRAEALEGIGMPADAARAWLLYGSEAGDDRRGLALREAARLSLDADDELGALFACREAERFGLTDELGPYWHEARVRLGLESDESRVEDAATRLAEAEELLERDEAGRAATLLQPVYAAREVLGDEEELRVLVAWADCTERLHGVDEAVALLRQERLASEEDGRRRTIDAAAARLLERCGLYDRAADAYEGRY